MPADVDNALLAISKRRETLMVLEDGVINGLDSDRAGGSNASPSDDLRLDDFRGGRWPDGLWSEPARTVAAGHDLRIQDSEGAKPGDLPVEQPVRFDLVINVRTAQELRLTIPPSLLLRADKIIQ